MNPTAYPINTYTKSAHTNQNPIDSSVHLPYHRFGMPFTHFNPTPETAAKVLADLTHPANSLLHVAALHNTTPEALALWINSDEIQARLTAQGHAAASITRLLAANHTQIALEAIVTATRESRALLAAAPKLALPTDADAGPEASSPKVRVSATTASANENPAPPPTLREYYFQLEFRRRLVESLRKNSNLIFRLTRFEFFDPGDLPRPESKPRTTRPAQPPRPDINHDQLLQLLTHIAPAATTASPAARTSNPAPAPRAPQPIAHTTPDAGPEASSPKVRVESSPKAPVESSPKVRVSTTPAPAPRPASNSAASNTSTLKVRTAIPIPTSAPDTEALSSPLPRDSPHPGLPRPRAPASLLAAAGRSS
ncbi:hypothetical protein PHYC_03410 [Phycisphaerales bacterium]|nr:hypothetical protein PHYC_03410 [Phycisphaerales bacterium]